MHTLLVAAALLDHWSPIEEYVWRTEREVVMPVVRNYWIAVGVMEPDENAFRSAWSFDADVAEMQWRFEHMDPDTPPFSDADRLPPYQQCRESWFLCNGYIRFLEEEVRPWLLDGYETAVLDAVVADTKRRMQVWSLLEDCRAYSCGREGRRLRLQALRKAVGEDTYQSGNWPDPLPPAGRLSEWKVPESVFP